MKRKKEAEDLHKTLIVTINALLKTVQNHTGNKI